MLKKTSLIILFSLCGCASFPPEPQIRECFYYAEKQNFKCYLKQNTNDVLLVDEKSADKYIAFSPDDWARINAYIKEIKKALVQNMNAAVMNMQVLEQEPTK